MTITITQLKYNINEKSDNPNDNIFTVNNPKIMIINVLTFCSYIPFGSEEYYNYDLREPKRKIIHPDKIKETKKTVVNTSDWTNIPHYPTTLEKKENYRYLKGSTLLEQKNRKVFDGSLCIGMLVSQSALITSHCVTVKRLCFTILALSIQ